MSTVRIRFLNTSRRGCTLHHWKVSLHACGE